MDLAISFLLFWGIWLLVPIAIDGTAAVNQWAGVWFADRKKRRSGYWDRPFSYHPLVSLVVPVFNGADSVGNTIRSIREQTYPSSSIELIIVNNGSTDDTVGVIRRELLSDYQASIQSIDVPSPGKSWALNAGIYHASGEYVATVDSDTKLHPDAIMQMVRAFQADGEMGAATGSIQIEHPEEQPASTFKYLINECESAEYMASFVIGRQRQALNNSLYTLAGAFSFFRRSVLLSVPQYSNRTVSEDTDITFWIHREFPKTKIGCIAESIIYVEPIKSLEELYSQRVRWQRGELEVMASHPSLMWKNAISPFGFSPIRTLVVDHRFAFPRAVWTFLLPVLFFLGYPLPLVVTATMLLYAFYAAIDGMTQWMCYSLADEAAQERIKRTWWLFTVMPAYRFLLFWFRFGGFVSAMNEPTQWKTASPWVMAKNHAAHVGISLVAHVTRLMQQMMGR
jgi:biofilm PGA synthesis N-glycosyltransferase PgaC